MLKNPVVSCRAKIPYHKVLNFLSFMKYFLKGN